MNDGIYNLPPGPTAYQPAFPCAFPPGSWVMPVPGLTPSFAGSSGDLDLVSCVPIYIGWQTTFTAITVKVTTASATKTVDVAAYTAGPRGPKDKYLTLATGIDAGSTGTKTASGLIATFDPGWYWLAARIPSGVAITSCASTLHWSARRGSSAVLNGFAASGIVYNIAVLPGSLYGFAPYESRTDAPMLVEPA